MKLGALALTLAFAISALAAFAATGANAAPKSKGSYAVPVSTDTATGTFTINRFAVRNGKLTAIGTYTGTTANGPAEATPAYAVVTSGNGNALTRAARTTAAVQQAAATCQILDLTLGPLHLDLLGLVVDLNQVHLQITAEQGSGNLLGNLLCAVAGLLDNTGGGGGLSGLLQGIANLLNQILGQLQL
jgi:hypothetical protein